MEFLTKFRAFQLDSAGSLFSFFKPDVYTLIEARIPKGGIDALYKDLAYHNKEHIDTLHITSWDNDHCTYNDLVQIINHLRPNKIEIPSYNPTTNDGELCKKVILNYDGIHEKYVVNVEVRSKEYFSKLKNGESRGSTNIVYESKFDSVIKNDMSLIELFRSKGFNVASLGDCESADLADSLSQRPIFSSEIDVLILAHHGAANGFTTPRFLDAVKPKIAICSSNYDNQFDHPRPEIRSMLKARGIPLLTTKRGDVVIYQMHGESSAVAVNMAGNNEIEESRDGFFPKRFS